jgi:hypothetical protein
VGARGAGELRPLPIPLGAAFGAIGGKPLDDVAITDSGPLK